jgi:hypothetical protein
MEHLWNLNLIHFLDFYMMFFFVLSTARYFKLYLAITSIAWSVPGRWPKLLELIKQHSTVFMTWSTVLPGLMVLLLSLVQVIASRVVWAGADLTARDLVEHWLFLLLIVPAALAMFAVDIYSVLLSMPLDRPAIEKSFDNAEYWLRSRTAHVVRWFTLGFINPRQKITAEVKKALDEASKYLNLALWGWSIQVAVRVICGLSIWLAWWAIGTWH